MNNQQQVSTTARPSVAFLWRIHALCPARLAKPERRSPIRRISTKFEASRAGSWRSGGVRSVRLATFLLSVACHCNLNAGNRLYELTINWPGGNPPTVHTDRSWNLRPVRGVPGASGTRNGFPRRAGTRGALYIIRDGNHSREIFWSRPVVDLPGTNAMRTMRPPACSTVRRSS